MSSPSVSGATSSAVERRVRVAGRALARAGLVHAYGHCSERIDERRFLVCAAKPMGLLTQDDTGTLIDIDRELPADVLGEVRIHQQVYGRRPDVLGIVRFMSPCVMALSAMRRTPKARHGLGAYFFPSPPMWSDVQLVRTDELATGVATTLGSANAVVMRGNGAITAAPSLQQAVAYAWYLEDSARVELAILSAGASDAPELTADEARTRATGEGRIFERMWEYLTNGDVEREPL